MTVVRRAGVTGDQQPSEQGACHTPTLLPRLWARSWASTDSSPMLGFMAYLAGGEHPGEAGEHRSRLEVEGHSQHAEFTPRAATVSEVQGCRPDTDADPVNWRRKANRPPMR